MLLSLSLSNPEDKSINSLLIISLSIVSLSGKNEPSVLHPFSQVISLASSLYLSVAAYLHVAIFLDTDPYTSASVLSKFRQIAPHSDLIGNQVLLLLFSHHILLLIDIITHF